MKKILIIEDDPHMRTQMAQVLSFEGFEPIEAANGRLGVEQAFATRPDLIVCDIMMPELDGFGVLQALRDDPRTNTTPFIFLTALVAGQQRRLGMEEGADDYITKPFEPRALIGSVRRRLKKRRLQVMEAKRQAEEIGLAVATSLPPEIEQMLEHIATITDLLALKHGGGDPQVVEMQRAIQRESGRMRRMLRRMHLYGQIPQLYANRFDLQAPAELLAVCAPTITRVALEAAGRWNRQSSLVLNLEDVPLSLGEDYLGVMVDELVDNACKFSLAGTPIEISVRRLHGFWTLSVSDRGTGMTVEQIANVGAFRQFWSGAKKPPGLGMGLALVQGVARLHGCEFALESAAGVTTASVLVPLEA